jgi:hypothetical protein
MRLTACDFPPGTPLYHFFLWHKRRWRRDPRYRLARDPDRLPKELAGRLNAAIGNPDIAVHAAVFVGFEAAAARAVARPRRILVIRLSALGDFIQSLGPFAAIRRHHRRDHITRPGFGSAAGCVRVASNAFSTSKPHSAQTSTPG